MNTGKRIAQLVLLVIILVIGWLIVRQNIALADDGIVMDTEAIAPAQISDVYAVMFDSHGFLTIVLDNVKQPMADDGSCEGGPRIKVVYQFYPYLGDPVVQAYSPDQPADRQGCESDYKAAEQFAASLHLFMDTKGESVLVGPIEGMFTGWPELYQYILQVEGELFQNQVMLPVIVNQ